MCCVDPIEVIEGFIDLNVQSKDDDLFNQMMYRLSKAIYKPIAIADTLDKNYDTIVEYIQWRRGRYRSPGAQFF